MNKNIKNAYIQILVTIWAAGPTIAIALYSLGDPKWKIFFKLSTYSLLPVLVLPWLLFKDFKIKEYTTTFSKAVKDNLINIGTVLVVFVGIYFLVINSNNLSLVAKLSLFTVSVLSSSYLLLKVSKYSSLNLVKSFFKEDLLIMDKWIAVKTEDEQGADYRPIPLEGEPLKKVIFNIKPDTPFWRAGLKIVDPNDSILPLRSNKSILFHLGSTDKENYFGITAYVNGEWVELVNKILKYDPNNPISIKFEVNKNNFVKFYVNDAVEFEPSERINPRLLKKAYLAAWGDEHNYRVEFDGIGFLTRTQEKQNRKTVYPTGDSSYPEVLISLNSFTYTKGHLRLTFENTEDKAVSVNEITIGGEKIKIPKFSLGGKRQVTKTFNVAGLNILTSKGTEPEVKLKYQRLNSDVMFITTAKVFRQERADSFFNIVNVENSSIAKEE